MMLSILAPLLLREQENPELLMHVKQGIILYNTLIFNILKTF